MALSPVVASAPPASAVTFFAPSETNCASASAPSTLVGRATDVTSPRISSSLGPLDRTARREVLVRICALDAGSLVEFTDIVFSSLRMFSFFQKLKVQGPTLYAGLFSHGRCKGSSFTWTVALNRSFPVEVYIRNSAGRLLPLGDR